MKDYKITIEGYDPGIFIQAELGRFKTAKSLAQEAIYKSGLKSPFGEEESRKVIVYLLSVENGQIKEKIISETYCPLPESSPSGDQYRERLNDIMGGLPPEFHSFIESQAWERGHSSGYHEVLSIAEDLTEALAKSIKDYYYRLTSEN